MKSFPKRAVFSRRKRLPDVIMAFRGEAFAVKKLPKKSMKTSSVTKTLVI